MKTLASRPAPLAMALVLLALVLAPSHPRWHDSTSPDVDQCTRFACQG